jgi:hypothetical protein
MRRPEHLGPPLELDGLIGLFAGMIRIKGHMLCRVPVLGGENRMSLCFHHFRGFFHLGNKGLIRTINGKGTIFKGGKIALNINSNDAGIFC